MQGCGDVLAGRGVQQQVPVGQVLQEVPADPHTEGRFLVGCCGASPAQPGVPGALPVLWEGQGAFLTSQIGNCQK